MKTRRSDTEGAQSERPDAQALRILSRRAFVLRGSAALAVSTALGGLPPVLAYRSARNGTAPMLSPVFTRAQEQSLSAVQQHLFPQGSGVPGALDINALPYLRFVITQADFETDSRNFIVNGIQLLEESSMERFDLGFEDLDFDRKEFLLRYLADRTRWGNNWISLLLYYILEALLADPVYGCNTGEIGWKWLEHQAGFPRPTPDKIYPRL